MFMATPSPTLASLYGDTFEIADIKRIGPLMFSDNGNTFSYQVYFYDGTFATAQASVDSATCKAIVDKLEAGRQKLIQARWPMAHKIVITEQES